jgi:hypothetical protein
MEGVVILHETMQVMHQKNPKWGNTQN